MKPTNGSLDKLELLFLEQGYKVRYEKGNFRSNSCKIQSKNVIVVNKFSTIENKITALLEVMQKVLIDESLFSDKLRSFYHSLSQTAIKL